MVRGTMQIISGEFAEGRKTKQSHPYSYDPVTQFQAGGEPNGSVYTDRLLRWDYAKHDELCRRHFGDTSQDWGRRDPKKIEAFLRDWCGDEGLTLVRVVEYCNQASGFPTWLLEFRGSAKGGRHVL